MNGSGKRTIRKNQNQNLRNCQIIYFDTDLYIFETEIIILKSSRDLKQRSQNNFKITENLKNVYFIVYKNKIMSEKIEDTNEEISFDEQNCFDSSLSKAESCMFCSGMDLLHCMQGSLMNKHSEIENFQERLINKIIEVDSQSPLYKKFKDIISETRGQRIKRFYFKDQIKGQKFNLLEFYKYRKFVPRFAPNRQSVIAQNYYYQRLKLYYNQIKRQLNITVDDSSHFSDFQTSQSITWSKNIQQTKVLQKLQTTLKFGQTAGPALQNYQTQSKALQDIVNFLKLNPKMDAIPPFDIQSFSKELKKSSKEIFRDFINKNKTKIQTTNQDKNKIYITFFSRSNQEKINNNNPAKPLKSQNLVKIRQPIRNVEIFSKLQKIKNEIINEKVKQIIKLKTKGQERITPIKLKTIKKENKEYQNRKSRQKINLQNFSQEKKIPFKSKLKPLSKLQGKRSQSQTKIISAFSSIEKNKNLRSISQKTMKQFLNGQKIQLEKQTTKRQFVRKILTNERPLSQRKSLDLTKLKHFLKESQDQKLQKIEKREDYLTKKYKNQVLETPKRFPKTANVTPIDSARCKDQTNQITLQKNDNIFSMKKKKLQILKKNNIQRRKSDKR